MTPLKLTKLNRDIAEQIREPKDKRAYVRRLFGDIAPRYDFTNDVMSLGLHRRWKRQLLRLTDLRPGLRVLDLAAGTGDLGRAALRCADVEVVAADLSIEMMQVGIRREGPRIQHWTTADAQTLPFPDQSFDRVIIGYGLRNFPHLQTCLSETRRCLRPGGRVLALDFGHPPSPLIAKAYLAWLEVSTRIVGWAIHRDPEAYVYIPESLRRFPKPAELAGRMEHAGFEKCGFKSLLLGTMAIHYGSRPTRSLP